MTALLASLVLSLSLQAAPTPGQTTVAWVNACQAEAARQSNANVREACACTAGLFAGRMSARQYAILGRMSPHIANPDGLVTEMRLMNEDGYGPEEIATVGTLIAELEPVVDAVCGVLE